MKAEGLRFTSQTAAYAEEILALSGAHPLGAEIFTYQTVEPDNGFSRLWAGTDDAGRLAALLYSAGEARTVLTPGGGCVGKTAAGPAALFGELPPADRFAVMAQPAPARAFPPGVRQLGDGARIKEALRLLHGEEAPHAAQARYVYALRVLNAGLGNAFGVAENGELRAVVRITAKKA